MKDCMRDGIVKRGASSWAFVVELGRDTNGKRRQKWVTVRGTRKDAERERDKMRVQRDAGTYVAPTNETFGDFLPAWLIHIRAGVSGKTFEEYERIVNRYLIPRLGPLACRQPTATTIQAYYLYLQNMDDNEPRTEGRGALAARTVLHHHWLLKESLDRAVKWQRMARNPMGDVIPPRPETKEARALTQPQTTTVIGLARGKRYYLAVMIALTTGMRRGEICALRWSKVDLARASLSVVQTLEEVKKRDLATGRPAPALTFKAPKTKKSRRTIALPAIAVEELRRHKAQQAKEKLLMGRAYADEDLVFANVDGTPYRPNLLTVNYASLIRRAPVKHGLHGTSFHTLRHTHATRLLEQGVHVKIVSERLGHSTIAITLDTYSHVLPGIQEGAAEKMDASLRAAIAAS